MDSAIRADRKEAGAIWQANAALYQAACGNAAGTRHLAAEALQLAPISLGVESEAALALAMTGDTARAQWRKTSGGVSRWTPKCNPFGFPRFTRNWRWTGRSPLLLSLSGELLGHRVRSNSIRQQSFCLYHVYIRGEPYSAAGQRAAAAAEFQKILDHSGIVWNCWTGAPAHLGVARANALQSRTSRGADADAARVQALAAYKVFPHALERRRPRHPCPEESQRGVREPAVIVTPLFIVPCAAGSAGEATVHSQPR